MIVLSGQVRYDTTVRHSGLKIRTMGVQEYDITPSVEPMTKYAVMVTDPLTIRYHLERAIYLAKTGRPGPVSYTHLDVYKRQGMDGTLYFTVSCRGRMEDRASDPNCPGTRGLCDGIIFRSLWTRESL